MSDSRVDTESLEPRANGSLGGANPTSRSSFSRERSNSLASQDQIASGRRKSASGWFKSLGQKLARSGSPPPGDSGPIRRVRTSSSASTISGDDTALSPNSTLASVPMPNPVPIPPKTVSSTSLAASAPADSAGNGTASGASSYGSFRSRLRALSVGSTTNVSGRRRSSATDSVTNVSTSCSSPGDSTSKLVNQRPLVYTGKHVGFAGIVFKEDPPQRIPPMYPKKGNVEFLANGELIVKPRPSSLFPYSPYLERNHVESSQNAMQRAHGNAAKLHTQLRKTGFFGAIHVNNHVGEGDPAVDEVDDVSTEEVQAVNPKYDIDGLQRSSGSAPFQETDHPCSDARNTDKDSSLATIPGSGPKLPTPDIIYTRCCHLREIMPIKNILRQLQGQLAPIPSLRIANTRPTMIEILAFSDFLTAVPVVSLSLDNHVMTSDMIGLILSGLTRSRDLSRLSFVNTNLDKEGWSYLCKFLTLQKGTLISLDLTCTNPTALGDRLAPFNRRDSDWSLLSVALATRGTLEELILDGTRISSSDFRQLMREGFSQGCALSVANNALDHDDIETVVQWASDENSKCIGINVAGNDLSGEWPNVSMLLRNPRFFRLSLRNTKLSSDQALRFKETFTKEVAARSQLRQLDLSSNHQLFPAILPRIVEVLPKMTFLSRLVLDDNDFTSEEIVSLASSICHCHRLVYLSLMSNGKLNETAATALCVAVHLSRSICTVEADTSSWSPSLQQQLTKYCLQNLESRAIPESPSDNVESDPEHQEILNFRQELITVTEQVESKGPDITVATMEKVVGIRDRVRKRMQILLEKKRLRPLSEQDRMALVRLFFFDSSLDRLYKMCAQQAGVPVPSPSNDAEKVSPMGEEDFRPALSRRASAASIISLKQLESEEGAVHKIANALQRSGEPISHEETTHEILGRVRRLHAHDLEKMIN